MTYAAYAQRRDDSEPPSAHEPDEDRAGPVCADCETELHTMDEGRFCPDCGVIEPRTKETR